jgi:hypothetical protein
MLLLDLQTVRLWLGMSADDAEHDTLLESLEERAVRALERMTGRTLVGPVTVEEILSGGGTDSLWLTGDAASLTSVEYRHARDWSNPWGFLTTDPTTDISVLGKRLIFNTGSFWPKGYANVRVTYVTGYTPETFEEGCPGLSQVLLEMIGEAFRGRPQALSVGPQVAIAWRGLTNQSQAIVQSYRRPGR